MARAATTTDVFNAIAEAKRREMIGLLNNGKYWTVSEIVGRMKITQPNASKHLVKKFGRRIEYYPATRLFALFSRDSTTSALPTFAIGRALADS